MKRLLLIICLLCCLVGCTPIEKEPAESPHLYWKEVPVIVTEISKVHWFASVHRYKVNITVYSEEYDIEKNEEITFSGMWGPDVWNYEVGDVVTATLYTWKMDSTGKIVKRELQIS